MVRLTLKIENWEFLTILIWELKSKCKHLVCVQDTDLASKWMEREPSPTIQDFRCDAHECCTTNMFPEEL